MSLYGAAGFPLMDGIPRGQMFVDFMRQRSPDSTSSSSNSPTKSVQTGPVPGGFNDDATSTTLSEKSTPLAGGGVRTDAVKAFSDGSRRNEVWHKMPDGSAEIATERRSLPDADGFEKVRVWERTTAPDGTKGGTFRLFRVPEGMQLDWNSGEAQQFLVDSSMRTMAADGTIVPDMTARPPELATDKNTAKRPVIPLAT